MWLMWWVSANFLKLLKFPLKLLGETWIRCTSAKDSCSYHNLRSEQIQIELCLVALPIHPLLNCDWIDCILVDWCFFTLSRSFPIFPLFHVNMRQQLSLVSSPPWLESSGGFGIKPSRSHNISELVSRCSVCWQKLKRREEVRQDARYARWDKATQSWIARPSL